MKFITLYSNADLNRFRQKIESLGGKWDESISAWQIAKENYGCIQKLLHDIKISPIHNRRCDEDTTITNIAAIATARYFPHRQHFEKLKLCDDIGDWIIVENPENKEIIKNGK